MVRATQRRRDIASPQCAYEFRQPALLNRFNNSTKVIWPRSVTRPAYSNLPYDFNYFANRDSETSRNYDFAISEELHVPNVPVHYKYSEAIALGIRGIYKKPLCAGLYAWVVPTIFSPSKKVTSTFLPGFPSPTFFDSLYLLSPLKSFTKNSAFRSFRPISTPFC